MRLKLRLGAGPARAAPVRFAVSIGAISLAMNAVPASAAPGLDIDWTAAICAEHRHRRILPAEPLMRRELMTPGTAGDRGGPAAWIVWEFWARGRASTDSRGSAG